MDEDYENRRAYYALIFNTWAEMMQKALVKSRQIGPIPWVVETEPFDPEKHEIIYVPPENHDAEISFLVYDTFRDGGNPMGGDDVETD